MKIKSKEDLENIVFTSLRVATELKAVKYVDWEDKYLQLSVENRNTLWEKLEDKFRYGYGTPNGSPIVLEFLSLLYNDSVLESDENKILDPIKTLEYQFNKMGAPATGVTVALHNYKTLLDDKDKETVINICICSQLNRKNTGKVSDRVNEACDFISAVKEVLENKCKK